MEVRFLPSPLIMGFKDSISLNDAIVDAFIILAERFSSFTLETST